MIRLLALTLSLIALGSAGALDAQAVPTVRVIGPANDGFTGVFYGIKSGIFRKYGLDVQTLLVPNGAAAAAALSGGGAEVAFTNTAIVITAHAHGIPIQYLTAGGYTTAKNSLSKVLVLKDAPIANARDLTGKTFASPALHEINSAIFMYWVDQTGGDSKTLQQIEVPASAGLGVLEQHRADVAMLTDPLASQALASGKVRELAHPYSVLGTPVDTAGLAVLAPTVEANRDVYVRFARAMREAVAFTNAHPDQTVDIVAGFTGATPETVRRSQRATSAEYLDPRALQPLIDIAAKYGLIEKAFPAADIISPAAVKP
jgi:NitT/TauT family transport system substrate-binding protein